MFFKVLTFHRVGYLCQIQANNNLNETTAHVHIFTMQVESVMYLLCE